MTIKRTPEKTTQLSVAQYQGQARPGEIVIDDATYTMYIANATGDLNVVGAGGAVANSTQIVNGASNVSIPLAGANVQVGVSGVPDVVNFAPTQVDFKANIIPVGDAVYSLGSPTNQFKDLYLSNTTLYLNLIPISITGNVLAVDGANVLTDDGTGTTPLQNVVASGSITGSNIAATGNVTAGSNLVAGTNVIANNSIITDIITSRTGAVQINSIGTDQNVVLNPSGVGTVSVSSARISNVAMPTDGGDAASKSYVDAVMSGLIVHQSVAAATTATLGGTYNPGTAGIGATFTTTTPISFIDNYALQIGDRVLIKNQVNAWENGIYTRTSTSIFTRATDSDQTTEFDRCYVFVSNGTINGRTGWVQTNTVSTIGGSAVTFYQFNAASLYNAGLGLALSGTLFSLTNTGVLPGTYGTGRLIPSITVDSQGRITSVSNVTVDSNSANITGTALSSNVLTSSLTSVGTLSYLNMGGVSNLGPVGNVIITGGTNGQVLTTNGTGNLSWGPFPTPVLIANGATNVDIPIGGGNVVFTAGTWNSANVTAFGITTNNLTSNGNVTTSNLVVSSKTTLGSVSNVKITGGFAGDVLSTDGLGNLTWSTGGGGGAGYIISNGTSNVSIPVSAGNIEMSVNGVANILVVSVLGANVTGLLGATDALITGNLTVSGTTNYVNVSSLQVSDPVIDLGGGANGVPLTVNDGKDRGTQLTYFTTQQVRAFMGWDNSNSEFAFGSNVTNVNDVMTFNQLGNVRANTFIGNVAATNMTVSGTTDLGALTNITITGGASGEVLTTDGFGTLSWATPASGVASYIANGTSTVTIPASSGEVSITSNSWQLINAYSTAAGVRTLTLSGDVIFNSTTSTIDFTNLTTANLGAIGNLRLAGGTSGQILTSTGSGGLAWSNPTTGSIIANGFSNVTIPASSGNITTYASGVKIIDANVDTITVQNGVNLVMGTGNADFSAVTKTKLGAPSQITITGGTSGQVLTTDGSGTLSWTSGGGGLSNGTSNVSIPTASSQVLVYSNGGIVASFFRDTTGPASMTSLYGDVSTFGNGASNIKFGVSGMAYSLADFTYVSNVNLPDVANIHIQGGTSGQVLTTDGAGTLSWATGSGGLSNGTSNVSIPSLNGAVQLYSDGVLMADFQSTASVPSILLTGAVTFTSGTAQTVKFGDSVGPLGTVDFTRTSNVTLGPVANVHITGGTSGQVLTTDGAGTLSWATGSGGGNSISNGSSNVNIAVSGGPVDTYIGGAHVMRVNATELTMLGGNPSIAPTTNATGGLGSTTSYWGNSYIRESYIAANARIGGDILIAGNIGPLAGGLMGNLGESSSFFRNAYSGNVYLSNLAPLSGGTEITVIGANLLPSANITYSLGSPTMHWKDIYLANNTIHLGDSVLSVTGGNLTVDGNSVVVQNTTGNTVIEGNIVAPGEIVANGNIVTYGDMISFANLSVGGTANLGPVGNVIITGGTSGQVLTTDGNGVLSWTTSGGGGGGGSIIANGTSNVTVPVTNGGIALNSNGVSLMTLWKYGAATTDSIIQIDGPITFRSVSGVDTIKFGDIGLRYANVDFRYTDTIYLGNASSVKIEGGTNGQVLTTNGNGVLSWTTVSGGGGSGAYIANGSSNISTEANSFTLNANGFTIMTGWGDATDPSNPQGTYGAVFGGWKYSMFGGARWDFSNASNVTLSSIGNLHILGGTNGQVLSTDGSGTLSWTTVSGGGGTPGGSNTQLQFNDAGSFGGSANLTFDKVTSTLSTYNLAANGVVDFSNSANIILGNSPISGKAQIVRQEVVITGTGNISISGPNINIGTSKWPSGPGNSGQVLSTDGNGTLSWANAGGSGGVPTYIENGSSTVGFDGANGNIIINSAGSFFRMYTDGTLGLPPVGNTQANISGTVTEIQGNPYPASGSGSVIVWTATNTPVGAKMLLRAQHSDGNIQMMEIMMAKQGSTVVHTVSNRIKTDTGASDIGISVALNSGNLEVTASTGGSSYKFTHSVTQFETTV